MAKIISETVVVTISRLFRNDADDDTQLISDELVETVDATLQEILGEDDSLVVEVRKGE